MIRIWKYTLEDKDVQEVAMPAMAKILCAQVQDGRIQLWAAIEPKEACTRRKIFCVMTGGTVPEAVISYIGTVQLMGGALVVHVYEGQ